MRIVSYAEQEKISSIKVTNYSNEVINVNNFDNEGYSTKGDDHIGLGLSIVRRIAAYIGCSFTLQQEEHSITATLGLPAK